MDPFARKMALGALAFGSAMLLMAAALSVVYFHLHPRCSEQALAESISPDGQWTATVMERRCGEESPFLVHVNLRRSNAPIRLRYFSGKATDGEVFVTEEAFAGGEQSPNTVPVLEWNGSSLLNVRCSRCSSAFAQVMNERWQSIRIRYSEPR